MPSGGKTGSTRVFLLDSHDIFRLGMRLSLTEHDAIEVVGEATTVSAALASMPEQRPHVLVVGIRPHESDLVQQLVRVKKTVPRTRMLVVSRRPQDNALALRLGATATLTKDIGGSELTDAVLAAAADEGPHPHGTDDLGPEDTADHVDLRRLTTQERRVLGLIGLGMSNREIAEQLFLAEKTVRNHVTRLLAKLGVSRRTQAALIAVREGAVTDDVLA